VLYGAPVQVAPDEQIQKLGHTSILGRCSAQEVERHALAELGADDLSALFVCHGLFPEKQMAPLRIGARLRSLCAKLFERLALLGALALERCDLAGVSGNRSALRDDERFLRLEGDALDLAVRAQFLPCAQRATHGVGAKLESSQPRIFSTVSMRGRSVSPRAMRQMVK